MARGPAQFGALALNRGIMTTRLSISQIAASSLAEPAKLAAGVVAIFKIARSHADEIDKYIDFRAEISEINLTACRDHLAVIRQAKCAFSSLLKLHQDQGHEIGSSVRAYQALFDTLDRATTQQLSTIEMWFER